MGFPVSSVSEITALSDQAIEWVILLRSGHASEQEKIRAEEWCKRTTAHQQAYEAAELLWLQMGETFITEQEPITPAASPAKRPWLNYFGASFALLLVLVLLNPFEHISDRWLSDYATAIGEQRTITLSDGSQVILNTDTAIALTWTPRQRHITLLRGQAQFSVAADPQRPFEVATQDAVVKALGTVFEVLANQDNTRVTVLEHAVGLKSASAQDYAANSRIEAGQQVYFSLKKGLEKQQNIDLKQNAAWQRGKLIVKNQPLSAVLADINRYYRGKIWLRQDSVANLKVTGVFPLDNPAAVLSMLEQSLPLKVTRLSPWLAIVQSI